MLEKRIVIVTLVTGLLLGTGLSFGQPLTEGSLTQAEIFVEEAKEKAQADDFPAAIVLYQEAIDAASDEREREGIREDLDDVTKRFYIHLYQQAQLGSSREETIKILIQARSLNVEEKADESRNVLRKLGGWIRGSDNDFETVVGALQSLRLDIFDELLLEGEAAARERAYDKAVLRYQQARELEPDLFNSEHLQVQENKLRDQIKVGQQLALEGQRLVLQRKYQEAEEKFRRADTLYPGQAVVAAGLKGIQINDGIRTGLLALFDGRSEEAIQILESVLEGVGEGYAQVHAVLGAVYCYRALMNIEPDTLALGKARDQFRVVLNLQPDYQLPEQLFSPRILGVFEQLRSETRVGSINVPDRR